jgi:uncharacterized protein (DUF302 family)
MKTTTIGSYAIRIETRLPFDEAIRKVTERLAAQGFGILTEIDVQATLKQKLGLDTRPYRILGACNPPFAHRALTAEPLVGVFLPCNVVVWDEGDRRVIAAMEPRVLAEVMGRREISDIADQVSPKIRAALEEFES